MAARNRNAVVYLDGKTDREPTADELYLKALKVYSSFITEGVKNNVNVDNGRCAKEIRQAVWHYREKAGIK